MDEQSQSPQAPQTSASETPAPTAPAVHGTPDTWPGAFGAYKYSKAAVMENWQTLLSLILADIVVSAILQMLFKNFGRVLSEFASLAFSFALYTTYIAGVRSQKLSFGEAFKKCTLETYTWLLLNSILIALIAIGSLLLLVVPFFFVMPRLLLAQYFLVDKHLGPVESLKASWEATEGRVGVVYGIIGATIAMALLALTIIGIPFALYFLFMYGASLAVLYEFVGKNKPAGAVSAPTESAE